MAKDRTPGNRGKNGPARGGSSSAGKGTSGARNAPASRGASARNGATGRGRTRPPTQVVSQSSRRPWGLIAGALAVVVFAVAAIGYAVVQANRSEAGEITDPTDIAGLQTYDYEGGTHVDTPVDYTESPPVGGEHAGIPEWADCTGTVYDVDIRHENAVHSLEHGAVWITYNPDDVSDADIATLAELVDGESGRMLSPYEGQDTPVSVQSWNHQLKVDSATDARIKQYADFFTYNADYYPEPGASCENTAFIDSPRLESEDGQTPADGTSTPAPSSTPATEPTETDAATGSAEATATAAQ